MLKECLEYSLEVWVVSQPHKSEFEVHKIRGEGADEIKKKYEYYPDMSVLGSSEKKE